MQCELHWFVVCICNHEDLAVPNRMDSAGPTVSGTCKIPGFEEWLAEGMFLYDYVNYIYVHEDGDCRFVLLLNLAAVLQDKWYIRPSLVFR